MNAKTTIGFAIACLLVIVSMVSSGIATNRFIEETRWTVHTLEVRAQIERVQTYFVTAQNTIRGYHMNEEMYYMDRHNDAKATLKASLEDLRKLTVDNPFQRNKLEDLAKHLNEKFGLWENSLELRRKGGYAAIKQRLLSGQSKSHDEVIMRDLAQLRDEENRLMNARLEASHIQGDRAKWIGWIGGALACIVIALATIVMHRDNRRRQLAEENIERFFSLSLDLLCISGMDGFFKRLSPSYSDVLGYPLQELYTRPILDFVHPDDAGRTNAEIQSQMKGNNVLSFENRFRRSDGTYRTFSWKSVPVGDLMYAVARDVTEQKEFESKLMAAREQAQKATVAKSAFLANMSHEIRTPLNGVVGMTEILARTPLSEQQTSFVGTIRTSARNLLKIINEILDFSKIEAGQFKLDRADFDPRQVVASQLSLIGTAAHDRGLRVESSIDPAVPPVLSGDSGKIGQILLNLLNNAVKFTDRGVISINVNAISVGQHSCRLRIEVNDSGIGIDEKQKLHLFEAFEQADTSTARRYGGTGLGLSICKSFVELMGGSIGVESTIGKGSQFWFMLDLDLSKNAVLPAPPLNNTGPKEATEEQRKRRESIHILLAEDNHINQAVAVNMIESLNYVVQVANNGEEAVQLYKSGRFHMILMDQHMPVMDGVTASAEIRLLEHGTSRRIPIIAFTATVIQNDEKDRFNALMDDFILKPVTPDVLETVLGRWEKKITVN